MYNDYFKPPYKFYFGETKVFTKDNEMAFDFIPTLLEPNAYVISKEDKQSFIDILNGADKKINNDFRFQHANGTITLNDQPFIWVRSWGRLTGNGAGGLGLTSEKAIEIMNSFADFIVNKFNGSIETNKN